MKARHISYLIACMIMLCCLNTQAQNAFPYPALPDTLRSVEQRATYLSEHYWDNYQFADTTQLKNEEITEQGFVNFIDILTRFNDEIAQKGISAFSRQGLRTEACQGEIRKSDRALFRRPTVADEKRQGI